MVADSAYETRLRNVKQTEYEILTIMMTDERVQEIINDRLRACIPERLESKRGQVCLGRVRKAKSNLGVILQGMRDKRLKHLPPGHIDYEGDA